MAWHFKFDFTVKKTNLLLPINVAVVVCLFVFCCFVVVFCCFVAVFGFGFVFVVVCLLGFFVGFCFFGGYLYFWFCLCFFNLVF